MIVGIVASTFLVIGALLPDAPNVHPARSLKNQCFAIGNIGMIAYAWMRFLEGGSVFFLFLEAMMMLSTILMLTNAHERLSQMLILPTGMLFSLAALLIDIELATLLFVIGLTVVSIGFISRGGTLRRSIFLTLGSGLVAVFSAIQHDVVFLWMNAFFALFSLYHVGKIVLISRQKQG